MVVDFIDNLYANNIYQNTWVYAAKIYGRSGGSNEKLQMPMK